MLTAEPRLDSPEYPPPPPLPSLPPPTDPPPISDDVGMSRGDIVWAETARPQQHLKIETKSMSTTGMKITNLIRVF
jgi:hypothetical protein